MRGDCGSRSREPRIVKVDLVAPGVVSGSSFFVVILLSNRHIIRPDFLRSK